MKTPVSRSTRTARGVVQEKLAQPKLRVLVVSHGHPAFTRGGAEIAAYTLYKEFSAQPDCEAWFLGCRPEAAVHREGVGITQPLGEREYVYQPGPFDVFKFANRDPSFPDEFRALLRELRPDVIHFHHFIFFGVEAFEIARRTLPRSRIVLTVHEYLLICHAFGQMVTRKEQNLCYRASFEACHACFPDVSPSDFFLRTLYIRRFIIHIDAFIAPSHFLARRLTEWGVDAGKLSVIDNIVRPAPYEGSTSRSSAGMPLRVGYFGQISRLKGIAVAFAAAALLEAAGVNITFDIHGVYRGQAQEFQDEFVQLLSAAGKTIRYHGGYAPQDVSTLMRRVELVLVPSIWWENSPVVIQEARLNHRPVICSNIGGMAEKVQEGVDGWHFPVGDPHALAALLKELESNRATVTAAITALSQRETSSGVVRAHRDLYAQLNAGSGGEGMAETRSKA